MKNIFKYAPIILGLVMVMSSCGDDDETEPAAVINPTLNISVNGNQVANGATVNLETESSVSLSITANRVGSGKDLNTMSITHSGDNLTTPFTMTEAGFINHIEGRSTGSLKFRNRYYCCIIYGCDYG